MRVYMGPSHRFNPMQMTRADIMPEHVATALARINRYGGNGKFPYSVAQHSWLLSHMVPPRLAFAAIAHDMPEMWTGDVLRPVKTECPEYNAVEEKLTRKLGQVLGIPYEQFLEVTPFDIRICNDEQLALFDNSGVDEKQLLGASVFGMSIDCAARTWLQRFEALSREPSDAA